MTQYEDPAQQAVYDIAVQAWEYAFPLLMTSATKDVQTYANDTLSPPHAPVNQFANYQTFPTPQDKDIVQPNADTLYSNAWLDGLSVDPVVLHVPLLQVDGKDRFFLLPILDAYTNVVASPGMRTQDKFPAGDYAIVGPNFKGDTKGLPTIAVPTDYVWILGRTQTFGAADYDTVHTLQKEYALTPLSKWGTTYVPPTYNLPMPAPFKKTPLQQVLDLNAVQYFTLFTELWKVAPPLPQDGASLKLFEKLNFFPGQTWDPSLLPEWGLDVINQAMQDIIQPGGLEAAGEAKNKLQNNWMVTPIYTGEFDVHYMYRAYIAMFGIGANMKKDAVYYNTKLDSDNNELNSKYNYKIHFDVPPPVGAFWSLTMYNESYYFVENSINRYSIGSNEVSTGTGGIDIWIQAEQPEQPEQVTNWLPSDASPDGALFNITIRMYWPDNSIITEQYKVAYIEKIA